MLIIDFDDSRLIDLPGLGPCPRPVDIDQKTTGFKRLKSLRIYRFYPGPPVHGDSEVDEVFILPLAGGFDMVITGTHGADATVTREGPFRAMYMPPQHAYRLMPRSPVVVAYARAEAVGLVPSQALGAIASRGLAEHLHYHFMQPALGANMNIAGEALVHVIKGAVAAGGQAIEQGQTLAVQGGEVVTLCGIALADLLIISL